MTPYKDLLPPLATEEFEALKASIKANGVEDAVWEDEEGNVLDGHHRLMVDPKAPRRVKAGLSEAEKKAFVFQANFRRRNLSPAQKAEARERMQEVAAALRAENAKKNTQAAIARMLGVTRQAVSKWFNGATNATGCNGCTSKPDARVVVPRSELPAVLERVESGESQAQVAADYGVSRQQVSNLVRQAAARRRQDEDEDRPTETPDLPRTKYRCIVIDPPWPIEKIEREARADQGKKLPYATMTLEQIAGLPVGALGRDSGCHLYLWVTQKFLPAGLRLVEDWGFSYQCLMTWVKPTGITPYSWMYNTEHVIFATKGSLKLERLGLKLAFEASVKKGTHSKKPDVFFDLVRQASPEKRLEMFAREPHDGFEAWGNQAKAK